MSVLRPLDKQPGLNTATILLVGTEDALLQQLADSMLKEDCASELKVHLARSLPLPSNVNRPRIDLIVFVVNLHSKYSLRNVEESLHHVDTTFFLGKVGFLITGAAKADIPARGPHGFSAAGREGHCSIHRNTVVRLARTYRSPLLFCDLEVEGFRATVAQRLVRMLQICAGHVPGVSALNLLSLLRSSENPALEDV
ncbi:centromere protein M isoform X3 [Zalophus californianus]|uniref:Centromere protein M n=2 Tax=Otariidae TaxID=9702 RepID=A0A3Q7PWS8_CALUR|nr:centromere protein M isoform X3 [Callorhinus ursinus]XP_027451387.1 centromere protein M isoform X3 [Zalophus californianus]XP_027971413.1 centromere protein M isoform X3 [Eumetopias jubatus]